MSRQSICEHLQCFYIAIEYNEVVGVASLHIFIKETKKLGLKRGSNLSRKRFGKIALIAPKLIHVMKLLCK